MTTQTIPKGWTITTLGEVASKIGSGATPRGGGDSYKSEGISLIRSQNVHDFRFEYSGLAFIDEEQASELANVEVKSEDVLLNITGDSVARVCLVPENVLPARVNQHVCIIRTDESSLNSKYLYYHLLNPAFKSNLLTMANTGATRNALTKGMIERLEILSPADVKQQKAIAAVLSALDDKIELLRKNNKTLENIAQTLFKRWFVDYDFPNEKGKPYKSSGGKMIDSELGEIPAGWRFGYLDECIQILSGGTPKTSIDEYWNGNIPWFSVVDTPQESDVFVIDCEKCISELGLDNSSTQLLPVNTTIITARGTVGKLALTGIPMAMNQSCYGIRPKNDKDVFYIYRLMKESLEVLKGRVHGAVFDTITRDTLNNIPCVIPSPQDIGLFEQTVRPLFQKVLANKFHIKTLSRLRDSLLPKLMKGELRVKGFN